MRCGPWWARAGDLADGAAAMIDGAYLHEALGQGAPDGARACAQVQGWLDAAIEGSTT